MNYQKSSNNPERILKVKPFINNFNWNEKNFPPQQDYEKFETNYESIALIILYIPHNIEDITHFHKSKFNLTREPQVILLMITDGQRWHYLAVKKLNALLKKRTDHSGNYCLNCIKLFRTTKSRFETHKKKCQD